MSLACRLVWLLATVTVRMPIGSTVIRQTRNSLSDHFEGECGRFSSVLRHNVWLKRSKEFVFESVFVQVCFSACGRSHLCLVLPTEQMEAWRVALGAVAGGEEEDVSARVWGWPPACTSQTQTSMYALGLSVTFLRVKGRSLQWHSMESPLAAIRSNQQAKKYIFLIVTARTNLNPDGDLLKEGLASRQV